MSAIPNFVRADVSNWYWVVGGNTTRVYSSASNSYVALDDATYVAWLADGKVPTNIPSEAELWTSVGKLFDPSLFNGTTFVPVSAAAAKKISLKSYAAAARYSKEIGGVAAMTGVVVATDRESQAMITGAYNMAVQNPAFTTQWKTVTGTFVTVNAAEMIEIAVIVGQHVAVCFATEATIDSEIDAGTITTTTQIDAIINAITP